LALLLSFAPALALAQQEEPLIEKKEKEKKDKPAAAPAPDAQAQGRFQIRRGFFAEGDLGVFMTFGGKNTNDPMLPSRTVSNLEPHLGVTVGYDVLSNDSFNLAVGAQFAMGLNGGLGRVSNSQIAAAADTSQLNTISADYSVFETSLQVAMSFMLNDRFALTTRLSGGLALLDPDPSKTADLPGAGGLATAPVFGVGVGLEYYTLLNDFAIGIPLLRFQGILAPGGAGFIPGLAITVPVKYTF
jgi:hypothetical protein